MTGLLFGKVVLVTGGANGIGRAIAAAAAEHGARAVIVADLTDQPRDGASVEALVTAAGAAYRFCPGSVTDAAALGAAVASAEPFGGLDMIVANAGMGLPNDTLDIDDTGFEAMIDINMKGVFKTVRAAAKPMIARGTGGSVIIIASMGGVRGAAQTVTYSATKGAARLYAQSLADALGPHNIRVNAICPGVIDTGFAPPVPEVIAMFDGLRARTPLRRSGTPAEVANVAVWLGSDLSTFVTGTSIMVDGGLTSVI